jgi:hypothetical protein
MSAEQPSQLEAGQQCEHRARLVQPDGMTADSPRHRVALDLLNDQEEKHHPHDGRRGMNSPASSERDRIGQPEQRGPVTEIERTTIRASSPGRGK